MKKLFPLLCVGLIIITSCNQQNDRNTMSESTFDHSAENSKFNNSYTKKNDERPVNRGIKYHNLIDPQFGIPFGAMPIPASWNESNNTGENLLFEGPNGVKIYKAQTFSHFYSNDPQLNQSYQQSGYSVQPVKNIQRFIDEDLNSIAQSQGIHFVRQYPLPQIVQFDTRLDSYLFKGTPEQKQFQCVLTEWEDQQGNPSLVIVRYSVTQYQVGGIDWGYTLNVMDANKEIYEETKNAYINSIVNFQINPQWVQTNNRYWSQRAQQSNAAHQQRMADIKAFGEANTRAHNARMEMSDRNFESYQRRSAMTDAGHSNYIDGIWDRTNVTDPNNGQRYKVESGSDYYWMNNNGEYIKSDNPNYNPNTDPLYNNQNWTQTTINN